MSLPGAMAAPRPFRGEPHFAGSVRSTASAGRWSIIVMSTSLPARRASGRRCGLRRRRPVRSVRQLAVQPAQFRAVDRLIDRLRHQVQLWPPGELHLERLADLLRAPPLLQPPGHELTQHRVIDQLAAPRPCPPIHGQPLRGERSVFTAAFVTVAAKLPPHRRRTAAHLGRDRPHRTTPPMQIPRS